jgi:hypothetical protein
MIFLLSFQLIAIGFCELKVTFNKLLKKFLASALLGSAVLSVVLSGEIRMSHHDFSGAGWSGNEICKPCHTPHNANTTVLSSPLWNHALSTAAYALYSSSNLNAIPGQPSGHSKLCLSCHDGTVAIDSFGERSGSMLMPAMANFGTTLSDHHPISFTYDSATASADGNLRDPGTAPSGLGGTIAQDLLFNNRLECSSCHDVHVKRNNSGCAGCHNIHLPDILNKINTKSLRIDNNRSALCLTCHSK